MHGRHAQRLLVALREGGQDHGYRRIPTFMLQQVGGASPKAVEVRAIGRVESQEWNVPSRPRRSQDVHEEAKVRRES